MMRIQLWYNLMCVMKLANQQSDETIDQFEKDTNELRECMNSLVECSPIGMGIKHPRKTKKPLAI